MGLYWGGLIIGKIFASEIWGGELIFGTACYYVFFWRGGLLLEFYGVSGMGLTTSISQNTEGLFVENVLHFSLVSIKCQILQGLKEMIFCGIPVMTGKQRNYKPVSTSLISWRTSLTPSSSPARVLSTRKNGRRTCCS